MITTIPNAILSWHKIHNDYFNVLYIVFLHSSDTTVTTRGKCCQSIYCIVFPLPEWRVFAVFITKYLKLKLYSFLQISPQTDILEEVLKTSNGATFYVVTSPGDLQGSSMSARSLKTSMTFLTDAPGKELFCGGDVVFEPKCL